MDMRTLQASLEAIERVCTHKKANVPSSENASRKNEAGAKRPNTGATMQVSKKVRFCWGLKAPVPQNLFPGLAPYLLPRN
jgi:hypothetical protein